MPDALQRNHMGGEMIDRDITEPLIKALQRKLSNGRLPDYQRARIANIIGPLIHLQSPINEIQERRLRDMLIYQLDHFRDADGVAAVTEGR